MGWGFRRADEGALKRFLATLAALWLSCAPPESGAPAEGERLRELAESYFEAQLELDPLFATYVGDHRFDDRLANTLGPEHRARQRELLGRTRDSLAALDAASLRGEDRLTYRVLDFELRDGLAWLEQPTHLLPVQQFHSLPSAFAQLGSGGSAQPFRSAEDYRRFLARVGDLRPWFDQAIANMREGMRRGVVQPRILIEKALPQIEVHAQGPVEESLFFAPIASFPDAVPAAERPALEQAYRRAIREQIQPLYRRLADFLRDEYLPACRESAGLGALPGGAAWYAQAARSHTTTELSPEEIHALGLREVERLRGELTALKTELGFEGSLADFFARLEGDPRFVFPSAEAMLEAYRELRARVEAGLAPLFARRPAADFEIRPVEAFRAPSAATASYLRPDPETGRPGVFYVNTYDLPARPSYQIESIFLHEAIPGHHFQIALQQELELPRLRRFGFFTAYVEGWALYAESLGAEIGVYTDPYQRYGALHNEMWRALRLVVDTGIHARGWSRERAIAFMRENMSISETDAVAEVERYMALPGQALSYKIGALRIQALRERCQRQLGERCDLRQLHERLLESGALPLGALEEKLDAWLAGAAPPIP